MGRTSRIRTPTGGKTKRRPMPRTQAEIRDRFTTIRKSGDDIFGFRQEALLDAMTYETAASTGLLKEGVDASDWTEPDVAHTARWYLAFAIGKAVDHRGISASRSVEKLSEWLWCLGEDELAARFDAADYPQYGAPKLAMLAQAWGVEHDHADDPGWQRMVKGLPCQPICDAGCGE